MRKGYVAGSVTPGLGEGETAKELKPWSKNKKTFFLFFRLFSKHHASFKNICSVCSPTRYMHMYIYICACVFMCVNIYEIHSRIVIGPSWFFFPPAAGCVNQNLYWTRYFSPSCFWSLSPLDRVCVCVCVHPPPNSESPLISSVPAVWTEYRAWCNNCGLVTKMDKELAY